jgi:high affinity Mn2+ porin
MRHLLRLAVLSFMACSAQAGTEAPESWNAKLQSTYIWQDKPAFPAAYSGPNSLSAARESSYSFSTTAFLGYRLAKDTELYFNPEFVQGRALSQLTGLGGLTNGELQKTAGPQLTAYTARLFVRHTWGLGGAREAVDSDQNQLAGGRDARRLVLTAGKLALTDLFDASSHAHDGRTQFMNWSFLTHGAYDYAADARGYSWGAALEYYRDDWVFRAGRFIQPKESNGLALDFNILNHYGDQFEVERGYTLGERPGRAKLLLFRNVAVMGSFQDAIDYGAANGTAPNMAAVRQLRSKLGWGINLEQSLSPNVGVFARLGRNDGQSEAYAFTEIDASWSTGASVSGALWGRSQDSVGLGLAQNQLSASHQAFLAAGGQGFFLGDGQLRYQPETILETYYKFGFDLPRTQRSALTVGFQYIQNPGYNADRGPVKTATLRLHTEF